MIAGKKWITGNMAALKNVSLCMSGVLRLLDRPAGLPGIAVLYSRSGEGKTYASLYAQNKTDAIRVEVGESWTRKTLIQSILIELGVHEPRGALADLTRHAIHLLGDNPRRPLFIDEADKLVDRGGIELVREIHEHAQTPVLLIGEENLPKKLQAIERVHNRVLQWIPAQPCDMPDCRKLAALLLRDVDISDVMLERARQAADGRARRIVVTLSDMAEWARDHGAKFVPDDWQGPIFTGQPPQRRRA